MPGPRPGRENQIRTFAEPLSRSGVVFAPTAPLVPLWLSVAEQYTERVNVGNLSVASKPCLANDFSERGEGE